MEHVQADIWRDAHQADLRQETRVFDASGNSRREFLKSLAMAGAGALVSAAGLRAQATISKGRIDVHHHLFPPFYIKAMEKEIDTQGFVARNWSPQASIDLMDRAGVDTAMVSPVQRLVMDSMSDKSERARSLCRESNEYAAQMVKDFPGRFGNFAALPLPDTEGSLKEIAYAYDTLKCDGIALWTSYLDKWVGDPDFWPVFEELNRRNAVVFYHPARAMCCRDLPGQSGIIEYDIDTARAIDSMLFQGTLSKFPSVHHIFVHSGGAFTTLADRVYDDFPKSRADRVPHGVKYEVQRLYFDTAHASGNPALDALKALVPVTQILYGSDVPLRQYPLTDEGLAEYEGFSGNEWKLINRGNAERLFPRLKS
jgi:predicted TIM-barrel fold metal-dependent hydrolase